mmetsp:Transcript_114270/g.271998  ORF Transcript_114270/g.271998 Transcript_114270/m.271998 type:complete len:202 (+) Transcript_114270:414-1019(+)
MQWKRNESKRGLPFSTAYSRAKVPTPWRPGLPRRRRPLRGRSAAGPRTRGMRRATRPRMQPGWPMSVSDRCVGPSGRTGSFSPLANHPRSSSPSWRAWPMSPLAADPTPRTGSSGSCSGLARIWPPRPGLRRPTRCSSRAWTPRSARWFTSWRVSLGSTPRAGCHVKCKMQTKRRRSCRFGHIGPVEQEASGLRPSRCHRC